MKRTQIYLDERQAEELRRRGAARGATVSRMIREAIDQYLAEPDDASDRLARYRAALHTSFGVDRTDERGRARDPDGAQGSAGGEVGGPGHGGEPPLARSPLTPAAPTDATGR